jgi:hypothetical protein
LVVGPEAVFDLDLDEAGRMIGWPELPKPGWTTPSSSRRVVGNGQLINLLYPAVVALERLNAEGDSIRTHSPVPNPYRVKRHLPPLFPSVIPFPRPKWQKQSHVMQ